MLKKAIIIITLSAFLLLAGLAISFNIWINANERFLNDTFIKIELTIEKGDSFNKIYNEIFSNVKTPYKFRHYLVYIKKFAPNMKYGFYSSDGISVGQFLDNIAKGVQTTVKLTIPEGFNVFDIANALDRLNITKKDSFLDLALDGSYATKVTGENVRSLEGFLYPGTYFFPRHLSAEKVIDKLYGAFLIRLPKDFKELAKRQGLTFYEALTLASIVQKETYSEEESPIVASVFLNRLRTRMRLQADPTIIYGKYIEFDGNIRKTDIRDRSNVYNTYAHGGLPPTPISNPSSIALNAVIHPSDTKYLYFVADKSGNHLFSVDYKEHVNNVNRHQKR